MSAADLAQTLYEAYQARDWEAAATSLHDNVSVDMPATRERLDGRESVIEFQREYPEPWGDLTILRVVGEGDDAAVEIEVVAPDATFRMAAFWRTEEGRLREGVEYWVTVGGDEPPANRTPAS